MTSAVTSRRSSREVFTTGGWWSADEVRQARWARIELGGYGSQVACQLGNGRLRPTASVPRSRGRFRASSRRSTAWVHVAPRWLVLQKPIGCGYRRLAGAGASALESEPSSPPPARRRCLQNARRCARASNVGGCSLLRSCTNGRWAALGCCWHEHSRLRLVAGLLHAGNAPVN